MNPAAHGNFMALVNWAKGIREQYRDSGASIDEFGFARLVDFFRPATLERVRVIVCDELPLPGKLPTEYAGREEIEAMNLSSAAFGSDFYFIKRGYEQREAEHFHLLVHNVQFEVLGPKRYALAYMAGLITQGQAENPLDEMAVRYERRFERGALPFDAEGMVRRETPGIFRQLESEYLIVKDLFKSSLLEELAE